MQCGASRSANAGIPDPEANVNVSSDFHGWLPGNTYIFSFRESGKRAQPILKSFIS